MSRRDFKRLNRVAKKLQKGHTLSKTAVFNLSQQLRRSLY